MSKSKRTSVKPHIRRGGLHHFTKSLGSAGSVGLIIVAIAFGLVGFMVVRQVRVDQQPPATVSTATCPVAFCVALMAEQAEPDTITVKVGEYVQFNSADGKAHSLSRGKGGEEHGHAGQFSSGEFQADEGWRAQFNEVGTFYIHDHLNPKISILVIAYQDPNDTPTSKF